MKKIMFKMECIDKKSGVLYKVNDVAEFEDNRAKEILAAIDSTGNHYAEEVVVAVKKDKEEKSDVEIVEESKPKKKKAAK